MLLLLWASIAHGHIVAHGHVQVLSGRSLPKLSISRVTSASMLLESQSPTPTARADELVGKVQPTGAFAVGQETVSPPPMNALETATDALMETVCSGSGLYSAMFAVVATGALHAVLAFATLSGVLLDASIVTDLQLPVEQVSLGNSLVFFGWIPGAPWARRAP